MNEPLLARLRVPWVTSPTRVTPSGSRSASVSLASTPPAAVRVSSVSSAVVYASLAATGTSFTEVTVMFTVADVAVGGAVVGPVGERVRAVEFALGVYVNVPLLFTTTLPWLGLDTLAAVRVSPSTSMSFWSTPANAVGVRAAPSFVV